MRLPIKETDQSEGEDTVVAELTAALESKNEVDANAKLEDLCWEQR